MYALSSKDRKNRFKKEKNNESFFLKIIRNIIIFSLLFFITILIHKILFKRKNNKDVVEDIYSNITVQIIPKTEKVKIEQNIPPELFENNLLNKIRNRLDGRTIIIIEELYFLNGLIRQYKPKKLLEIGVCSGGSSAAILNAINDIEGSMLYSCDLEKKHYYQTNLDVGFIVKDYFPEFKNKWKLFTGNTTAAFIEQIGKDIDFVFIDTAHVMPGEVLNMIEIFPFLKKNAIIVFDDINTQAKKRLFNLDNFYPCNNLLMSVLRGKKIIFEEKKKKTFDFTKLGAIILDDNQEKYYYDYFLLLSNNWSYMPKEFEINTIRSIVKKYYDDLYLQMFDKAVQINYERLKIKGLLDKDYFLYTYPQYKNLRVRPSYK